MAVGPMAADALVGADQFGATLSELIDNLGVGVTSRLPEAVDAALEVGEKAWKTNARSVLSSSYSRGGWGKKKGEVLYKSGKRKGQVKSTQWFGKTIKTGKYARSIRHHMLSQGGNMTEGEIGSPSMPGLAHLLEHGHALVGGGSARAFVHIEPAADEAFDQFGKLLEEAIEEAIENA